VERLTVSVGPQAWTNYITTNIWAGYFSQASKLKASKNMLKAALNGAEWVRPVTNYTPETAETVTESNVLAWCGAPSGWWTNHPYVNIANSSNGWRFLPDVASNLVWYQAEIDESGLGKNGGEIWSGIGTGATAQIAQNDARGNAYLSGTSSNGYEGEEIAIQYFLDDGLYIAWAGIQKNTNYFWTPSAFDAYANQYENELIIWQGPIYDFNLSFLTYNDQQCAVTTGAWFVAKTEILSKDQTAGGSFQWTPLDSTSPPNDSPDGDLYGWSTLGGYWTPITYLHKYNATTNGFKWFR